MNHVECSGKMWRHRALRTEAQREEVDVRTHGVLGQQSVELLFCT